ncbi:MAG TPA: endonuclease III [Phycisphaerales bacterium]|nr:endonuclease III [Phycisphaerales bacterium]
MSKKRSKPKDPAATPTLGEDIPFDLPRVSAAERRRAGALMEALLAEYPTAHCELNYTSPHELLVATILSAQTTDVGVNKATPALFERFPTPADYARATPGEIEPYIKSTGFFRNKAKAVHLAMKEVHERFGDTVPRTMAELLSLHGVARKTANVVLGNAYGINVGFVVDTHIERLSKRFGLAPHAANVARIERRLMALFPRESWCAMSHALIWHGRRACKARGAACSSHPICAKYGVACELRVSASTSPSRERRTKPATPKKSRGA